jgi:hypothetical protein
MQAWYGANEAPFKPPGLCGATGWRRLGRRVAPDAPSEVAAARLLQLDGLEERLEVADTEAA